MPDPLGQDSLWYSDMERKKALLVESNKSQISTMDSMFSQVGYQLNITYDGLTALEKIMTEHFDLVITELNVPQLNGIDLLKKIKENKAHLPVVFIAEGADVKIAVTAMKLGAHDFIIKPLTLKMIDIMTAQIFKGQAPTNSNRTNGKYNIITENSEMNRILKEARLIANSRASIFIQGESGTGKELFARYIHKHSNRSDRPFVAINCAALPETLLESELFGHEKGAFTGAINRKKGKFELANQGTVLLDEISEMGYQLQSKLLRVLQEKEIDRVGGMDPIPIDFRVIATTNRKIEEQIEENKFREDLYYRLNIIPFHLPSLRERTDDIPALINYFLQKYNHIEKRNVKKLTEEAMQQLYRMPWKGNIRELENVIERAVLICRGELIEKKDLIVGGRHKVMAESMQSLDTPGSLKEMERKTIFHTLDQTNGNRTHAADMLGISVRTLRNKLKEYRSKMEEC